MYQFRVSFFQRSFSCTSKFWLDNRHLCSYSCIHFCYHAIQYALFLMCHHFSASTFQDRDYVCLFTTLFLIFITRPSTKYMLNKYLLNKLLNGCFWKTWICKMKLSSTTTSKLGSSSTFFNVQKLDICYSLLLSIYLLFTAAR